MNFEIVKHQCKPETLELLQGRRKWKTAFLDSVSKERLYSEISLALQDDNPCRIFCFVSYLTGGRRNEVLAIRKQDISKKKLKMKDGKIYDVLVVEMLNEKNKQFNRKFIPLVKGLDPTEDRMIEEIETHINAAPSDDEIFKKGHPTAINFPIRKVKLKTRYREIWMAASEELIVKFNLFPHYLRHCRLTHLNWLPPVLMVQFAGWSSSQLRGRMGSASTLLDTYIHKNWESLAKEMVQHGL